MKRIKNGKKAKFFCEFCGNEVKQNDKVCTTVVSFLLLYAVLTVEKQDVQKNLQTAVLPVVMQFMAADMVLKINLDFLQEELKTMMEVFPSGFIFL